MLYNDSCHGFGVRSWWPRVLWQAVMLWLVKRGIAVRRGRPVEQVCNRDMRTTRSDLNSAVRIESRAWDTQPIRGVRSSLTIRLARGWKHWHPLAPGRIYGTRRSPLYEYMFLHLSLKLTTNCVPLSRIRWKRYTFLKKYVSFVHWSSFIIFDYVLGWVYEKYTTLK